MTLAGIVMVAKLFPSEHWILQAGIPDCQFSPLKTESQACFEPLKIISVKEEQPLKEALSKRVTLTGSSTRSSALQPEKQ